MKAEEHRQAEIGEDERRRIRDSIDRRDDRRRSRVDVDINIGARLPRSVELYPLPAGVVEIVPAYRGYRYVLVDDEIVIVDPDTYDVVTVISEDGGRPRSTDRDDRRERGSAGTGAGAGVAGAGVALQLGPAQRSLILERVSRDRDCDDDDLRLEVGSQVARDVDLFALPASIVGDIPELEGFRYCVADEADGEVVIVDPSRREIVLVLERRRD